MARGRKTWSEKLEGGVKAPKTLSFDPKFPCGKALAKMGAKPGDSVVLAPGTEVDEIMRGVPEGRLMTIYGICRRLAQRHGTKYCCTLTTGIFIVTAAHAAEEGRAAGGQVTPYWRTVKEGGLLNDKFPGGAEGQKSALEAEGFTVVARGSRYYVKDYEKSLMD